MKSPGVCRQLLDAGSDVRNRTAYYGRSALNFHCHDLDLEVVNMLIDAGIDLDARAVDGETALMNSICHRQPQLSLRLLELGGNANAQKTSDGYSALHFAAELDQHEILLELLQRGADYNARTAYGSTIVHQAARYAGVNTIALLGHPLLIDLDIRARNGEGKTAAEYLAERKLPTEQKRELEEGWEKLTETAAKRTARLKPRAPVEDNSIRSQDE